MRAFLKRSSRFLRGEEGATLVEYGLLIGILSVAALATIVMVGKLVNGAFNEVRQQVPASGNNRGPGNIRGI